MKKKIEQKLELERVSKKQCKIARQRAIKLLSESRKELNKKYKFSFKLVGSGKWGTMVKDKNGCYDLDYQILLTKNSKEYKDNKLSYATKIKNDFFGVFSKNLKHGEKIENSKTAITLINTAGQKYHVDFVIIKLLPENNEIIRRNNKAETNYKNEFTWNKLPKLNEAYQEFEQFSPIEKEFVIKNCVIPAKIKEKQKQDNDESKISSCEVFVREINNYVSRKKNNRLQREQKIC